MTRHLGPHGLIRPIEALQELVALSLVALQPLLGTLRLLLPEVEAGEYSGLRLRWPALLDRS